MKCYYHSADLDGHCSGEIVRRRYPECQMIGINYGERIAVEKISPGETVFMVDFCAPVDTMRAIADTAHLVWIDHHVTAIADMDAAGMGDIDGVRRIGTGACALVYEHIWPGRRVPKYVRLLAEYDVWSHADPDCLPLQYGLRAEHDTRPGASAWNVLVAGGPMIGQIIANGRIVMRYEDQQAAMYARAAAFDVIWEGLTWCAMNRLLCSSRAFDAVRDDRHDGFIRFGWRPSRAKDGAAQPGAWSVSLYAARPDMDVSAIAKKYGGGGHAGAAGFSAASLPFELS